MQESTWRIKESFGTSVPVPAANLTDEAVEAQQLKKLSAKDVVDLVVDDHDEVEEAQQLKELSAGDIVDQVADNEAELPPKKSPN